MSRPITLGLIQMSMSDSVDDNLKKAGEMIAEAAKRGASVVCLPELFASQYFANVEKNPRDFSETIPGNTSRLLSEWAKTNSITLIGGSIHERVESSTPTFYNTTLVYGPDGKELGRYRKMHIPHDEGFWEKFYFAPGDLGYKAHETPAGKLGTLICFDQWFPEAARATALLGAELIFYPTAISTVDGIEQTEGRWQEAWENVMRGHAIANSVAVCAVNRVGKEGRSTFWGGSFVCDQFGKTLVRGGTSEEVILQDVDLDLGPFISDRWLFMPNRRIDSYGILSNKTTPADS